jgi:uncharacterized protein (TIGR02391 family)
MGAYDVQQVCLKGHQITGRYNTLPQHRRQFCGKCGSKTIHTCPQCEKPIPGEYVVDGFFGGSDTAVPTHCENCGAPFPWTTQDTGVLPPPSSGSVHMWSLLHPRITTLARGRVEAGHYADAVEVALKEVNSRVKTAFLAAGRDEKDGADLMFAAFGGTQPTIRFGPLNSDTGKNIQEGYTKIFAGAMQGVRNPKAHENITLDTVRTWHLLALASLLMYKLDESGTA